MKQQLTVRDFDIICMQEVDKFPEYEEFLATKGYKGFCAMKKDGMMGCAVFYKETQFSVVTDFVG
eukprot:CAMPEP_0116872088 /NCGR_PEP_ID=MMETSP0463-20121206/2741_1 /TAXON_ID=181622 /ORGANISM="Strombidinopsis sp, Strain SopsisLIS2011" /LENGTH=64 /DNA_ID=CAMNT_0004511765 /DNA_START=144 /DNA_END=338 /DNA_ORIENTATION=-